MKNKNIILIVIVLVSVIGIGIFRQQNKLNSTSSDRGHHEIWYCPMHPNYITDHPGQCPICGMNLVQKIEASKESNSSMTKGYADVTVTDQKQQLIGLRTQEVKVEPIVKTIRTFGTVASDAELYQTQGQFIDAYVDYVNAFRDYKQIRNQVHIWASHRDIQTRLLEAKDKLLKLGLSNEEISKLQNVSWNSVWKQSQLLLFNNSRNYWVMAQIFEQDYSLVHDGQAVEVSIPSLNNKFKGVVRSIGGFIDPTSRSVTALIELGDTAKHLAANMFVDITIPVKLSDALAVPRQAVMNTGLRKIIFVAKPGDSFEPREIQTGVETDNGYEVKSGLKVGDRIVVSGNFLLDSESRVQAGLEGESHE